MNKLPETSKVFKEMGKRVNVEVKTKSQRGIIARRYLKKMDKIELDEFERKMVNLGRRIIVKDGHSTFYI